MSFWDNIMLSDASWSSYSEGTPQSDQGSTVYGSEAAGTPPLSELEDMNPEGSLGWVHEYGSPVELAPGEEGLFELVGVPCNLHTKGDTPEISLSGIFSDEESEQEPAKTNARKRLGATGTDPAKQKSMGRAGSARESGGKSTTHSAGNISVSGVVYSKDEFELMRESLGLDEDEAMGETAEASSVTDVVYNDEELELMEESLACAGADGAGNGSNAGVVYNDEELKLMEEALGSKPAEASGRSAGNGSLSGVVYSEEEMQMMDEILAFCPQ